jgi:DNA-binding LacI/PurR family transcriptional regulator
MQESTTTNKAMGPASGRVGGRLQIARVVERLSDLCDAMSPGDRLPTHTELMRRLQLPERAVLAALKELHRQGRVERIHGSGTYVADAPRSDAGTSKLGVRDTVSSKTITALARPDHSYFDRCIEHLSSHVGMASHDLIVRPVPADRDIDDIADTVEGAAGYIVFGHFLAPLAQRLMERGERVVNVGTPPANAYVEVPTIYCDQEAGGYAVASHLLKLGHRNIAYLHDNPAYLRETLRWSGHMHAIVEAQRAGQRVKSSIIDAEALARLDSSTSASLEYFLGTDATTAVVAWNDVEAMRLLALFSRHGISAPRQVSVVGYDATEHGAIMHPSLTTVDNALDQQLRAAVDLLTRPVAPPSGYTVVMHPRLIERESTGPAAKAAG